MPRTSAGLAPRSHLEIQWPMDPEAIDYVDRLFVQVQHVRVTGP